MHSLYDDHKYLIYRYCIPFTKYLLWLQEDEAEPCHWMIGYEYANFFSRLKNMKKCSKNIYNRNNPKNEKRYSLKGLCRNLIKDLLPSYMKGKSGDEICSVRLHFVSAINHCWGLFRQQKKGVFNKTPIIYWSERHDLNVRPLPPQGSALAKLSYAPNKKEYTTLTPKSQYKI